MSILSRLYAKYSRRLLCLVVLSFPWLWTTAQSLPANNDVETWLPKDSEVRAVYEQFKQDFGVEELIVVGIEQGSSDSQLVEAVCQRLDCLPSIRKCWSPARLSAMMSELGVSEEEIREKLKGLVLSEDETLIGLICLLSKSGLEDRAATVNDVQGELDYCQLRGEKVHLAGAPVIIAELDRLGGEEENRKFFLATLLICLSLLCYSTRHWKLAISLMGLTVWAINFTLALIHLYGGEMNFILSALSVMVMIFTLAVSIHFMHYYTASLGSSDPLGEALRLAWKPCCLATLTTTIGLISLTVSDILPVSQFGFAAALGSIVALVTGFGLTPALLTIWPQTQLQSSKSNILFAHWGSWIVEHSRPVTAVALVLVAVTCVGLMHLETKIDPLDFLPTEGKVLTDARRVQSALTNIDSIEAVVTFDNPMLPFTERLQKVREIEAVIAAHPAVRHTMSAASFFPRDLPQNLFSLSRLLRKAEAQRNHNEYLADGERLWRISARINPTPGMSQEQIFQSLQDYTQGFPVRFTGIAPLLDHAQHEIFNGFWESFSLAFLIITAVMICSLWSWKTALIAMIPNFTPICIVFGILGWCRIPVDIGMMMSGSIALGIAVDGTFHFLIRYQNHFDRGMSSSRASHLALLQTGEPIFKAALISGIGMLALTLSSFSPTARFGYLMFTLLFAALLGDLVLLPSLLSIRPGRQIRPSSIPVRFAQPRRIHSPRKAAALLADRVA